MLYIPFINIYWFLFWEGKYWNEWTNCECIAFLLFGSRQQLSKVCLPFITIGDSQITPSSQARNLGVIFDPTMTLKPLISNIVRVSSFHIRNISRIRIYLNQSAAEQIIHAFVTSRLDNGNALLYGLLQNQISRLQHIQNTAAATLSRKSCHITPILKKLHSGFLFHRELFLNLC